ncbi:transformer-2 protein homolog beta-like isoform X6 [Photinus pyralis]|uniref:transformer-2 protein homolog beta-like isoform X6 n=1 Tax=Photinus pyralis TaxID=7054 RepID=UPI0012671E98|nr:transformer-2 protein homolog beta-like isoform X6 [Photinus pyralis]
MSDRGISHSPGSHKNMNDRDHSPHVRREDSPRNHKGKSYSRSPSRSRKVYRDDRDRDRRRDDRDRDSRRYRSRSHSHGRGYGRRSHSHSPMSSRRRHLGTRDNPKPSRCLGVFGLSVYTSEEELYHIFSKYGPVERVQVVIDAKTGRSRGFSFVYFESSEDAKVAKDQCNGIKINGKSIRVDFSITERAHTPTPGIYMGKPTYVSSERWDRRRDRDRESRYRRSPSPYYRRSSRRYERSRSRSYSPRLRTRPYG